MTKDSHQSDTIIIWEVPFSLMLVIIVITPALVALSSILIAYNIVLLHLPGAHPRLPLEAMPPHRHNILRN